jgi:phosphoribosyl 1,2-cyclic phosphate phosphodiesterase
MIEARLLFLGSGGSMGVPVIGCVCPVCTSASPLNKRLRPSVLISFRDKQLLIDTGPDLRQQALRYDIKKLDGAIITHCHNDHTSGFDELRAYYMRSWKTLPILCSAFTAGDLRNRYAYIFENTDKNKLVPKIDFQVLESDRGTTEFLGLSIDYISFIQAGIPVNGFRFGNLGFISDIKEYPESIFEDFHGIEKLVLSSLRHEPSPLHFSIDESIAFARRIGAKETWLTHIGHEVDHEKTNSMLPEGFQLAQDGLEITFQIKEVNER